MLQGVQRWLVVALLLFAVGRGVWGAFTAYALASHRSSAAGAYEAQLRRYATLQEALAGVARAGYVHDEAGGNPLAFLTARYAAAPTVLVDDPAEQVVVAEAPGGEALDALLRQGYVLRARVDADLVVLEKRP